MKRFILIAALIWLATLFFVGVQTCEEVRGDTGTKNYTVKDNKGNVKYRVHCEYGDCTAYDPRWYPQYKWQDPIKDVDKIHDFNNNPFDDSEVDIGG